MKKLSLILFLFVHFAYGQVTINYLKGFYINSDNQKIEGYIKDENLSKMKNGFLFKKELNAPEKRINSVDIKYLQLENGEILEKITIKENQNFEIFLVRPIVEGYLSLYKYYIDDVVKFILKKKQLVYVLKDIDINKPGDNETNNFQQLFYSMTNDCFDEEKLLNLNFDESNFRKLTVDYNKCKNDSTVKVFRIKDATQSFIIGNIGGLITATGNQISTSVFYRKYFPKISQSTSVNIGLAYYRVMSNNVAYNSWGNKRDEVNTTFAMPINVQQNFLNNNLRPYVFFGVCFGLTNVIANGVNINQEKGFSNNVGIVGSYGLGIEYEVNRRLMIKGEFRAEILNYGLLGISYRLK